MPRKKFDKGGGRYNSGCLVMHTYHIDVSVKDEMHEDEWSYHLLEMELPSQTKLSTILGKVERAIGMSGYEMTNNGIEIRKGEALPDTRSKDASQDTD